MEVIKVLLTLIFCTWRLHADPDIVISEINSCALSKSKPCEFVELQFVDTNRFLMLRNPISRTGPSLNNHYILILKSFDVDYGGPAITSIIDLAKSTFRYDNQFFTIATKKIFQNADLYFETSEVVHTTQNAAGIEQCNDVLDDGNMFPVGLLLIVTADRQFVGERLMLRPRRPYIYLTGEIIDFLNKTVVDAVVYGRNVKADRAELFDKMIDNFKNAQRYVLREYDYIGDSERSLSKCPTNNDPTSLRQPFASGLFKLGQPTHGEPNDCSSTISLLEMLSSPDLSIVRKNFRKSIKDGKATKQTRIFPPFEASECLMKHIRNNRNPSQCGAAGTDGGTKQKLSQLTQTSLPHDKYSGGLVSLVEAILARSDGIYHPENHDLENILVCKKHEKEFGRDWNKKIPRTFPSGSQKLICKFPPIPGAPPPHEKTKVASDRVFVSKEESEALLALKNVFIPPGWRKCMIVRKNYAYIKFCILV